MSLRQFLQTDPVTASYLELADANFTSFTYSDAVSLFSGVRDSGKFGLVPAGHTPIAVDSGRSRSPTPSPSSGSSAMQITK